MSTRSLTWPCEPLARVLGRLHHSELQLVAQAVDSIQPYPDALAQAVGAFRALTDDRPQPLAVNVAVVREALEGHKAFHEEVGQFHKKSVLGQADDERLKLVAHALRHKGDLFPLHQLALRFGG